MSRAKRGRDDPGQLLINWNAPPPTAAVDPKPKPSAATTEADPAPSLVQRLKWDFRTTFPRPTDEAIDAGIVSAEDAEPENLAAIHDEHAREMLAALRELEIVQDAKRRGVDPRTQKVPPREDAKDRLERWFQNLLGVYADAFGDAAAEAFGKAVRAWHAGIAVVGDDPEPTSSPIYTATASTPPTHGQPASRRNPARVTSRFPVPRPLPSAVAAGHFGREEDGKPVRPGAREIREITEQHAEKLIDLLDSLTSAPAPDKKRRFDSLQAGIRAYAEDFGTAAAEQLEAYVRRHAGLEVASRRGR